MKPHTCVAVVIGILVLQQILAAQTTSSPAQVPPVIQFANVATNDGSPLTGEVEMTFSLYNSSQGGSPLWTETQNVTLDDSGHYSVYIGITKPNGVPMSLFTSAQAHWLGVRVAGQAEQARVFLVSVPYAMKAGDASTIGGLPPSAFVLAAPINGNYSTGGNSSGSFASNSTSTNTVPPVGGTGTQDYIPIWTDSTGDLGNSVLYQTGSGSTAKIGLNLKTPLASLDVNGTELIRGLFESATTGTATATKGFNSNAVDLEASSFNSTTKKAVMQHFEWQAEPTGNNTGTPGATLNLLFGTNTNKPAETGLVLSNAGVFTFAPGQTFPGTGTITQVMAGTDLTGGGNTGNVTLNLDTTKVPQLNTPNTFSQTQVVSAVNPIGAVLQATSPYQAITGTMTSNDFFAPAIYGNASASGTGTTIGVEGTSATTSGYGVFGIGGSSGTGVYGSSSSGVGVYGSTSGGYGVATDSQVQQARSMGGWVKAMAFITPTLGIVRCFNSQLPASSASVPPCGMTFTYIIAGAYMLDFGFEVDDRFATLTAVYDESSPAVATALQICPIGTCGVTKNQYIIFANNGPNTNQVDSAFNIVVF